MANLLGVCWDVENWPCCERPGYVYGGRGAPLGVLWGVLLSPPAWPRLTPRGIIAPLTYLEHIMKDIIAAIVIGLALTVLALAYFDVLVQ